jgi:hypothetical protein
MLRITIILILILNGIFLNAQNISIDSVKEDINEFVKLLEVQSSYFQISNINLDSMLAQKLIELSKKDSIPIIELGFFLEEIMSNIKDSHASIGVPTNDDDAFQNDKRFPFPTVPFNNKVLALNKTKERGVFEYYNSNYPYIKSINEKDINSFLEYYSYNNNIYPQPAKFTRSLKEMRGIGDLYTRKSEILPDPMHIVLSNGKKDTTIIVSTHPRNSTWRYPGY